MSRDSAQALTSALATYFGGLISSDGVSEPWSSATFDGTRHVRTMVVPYVRGLARRVRDLPEAELPIRGGFVADIMVMGTSREGAGLALDIQALTIDEA